MKTINFDDNKTGYAINGDENRVIYISPTDTNISIRFQEVMKNIENYEQENGEIPEIKEITDDTPIEDIEQIYEQTIKQNEEVYKFDNYVKSQINYILDYEASDVIFGNSACTSLSANGNPLFLNFFEALAKIIEAETGTRVDKFKKTMNSPKVQAYKNKYSR